MPETEKSAAAGRIAGRADPSTAAFGPPERHDDSDGDVPDRALVELFEQITRWLNAGKAVDEEQLAAEHPAWAREIRALLPTLQGMADAGDIAPDDLADSVADDPGLDEGRRLVGDFRIVREIGRGGMGIVYEAEQVALGRRVALKVLPLAAALDPRAIQRFQLEAQVAGWLQHPRIVPVYAVGLVDEVPYFAMQYIVGGSLGTLIAELRGFAGHSPGTAADHSAGDSPSALALGLLTGRFELAREGEPPGEPSAPGGSAGASPSLRQRRAARPGEGEPLGEPSAACTSAGASPFRCQRRAARPGEGEPPGEPSASAGSAGASTSLRQSPDLHRGMFKSAAKASPSIRGTAYLRTVARLGIQAAEALAYAHDQGIIHRDVKPANLLLDRRGDLWVADFGMADVQGDAGLTLSGDLPGTLRYMSPEQAAGQRAIVDRRTDIYSLGATLYELLTLQPVVAGVDKAGIIRRIAEEEPVPIRRLNPAVPVDLATIVTKAISKSPANRYETALKLADDLDRFLDNRPIAARPVGPLRRSWRWCRRKPVQAGLAAALVLALVGGFAGITWNWREAVRQKHEAQRLQQEALLQKHEAQHQQQQAEHQQHEALRQKQIAVRHEHEALRQKQEAELQRQAAVLQKQEALRQKGLLALSQGRAEASEKKALTEAAKAQAINRFLIDKLLRQASPENNPANKRVTLLAALDHAAAEVGSSFKGQPEIEAAIRIALGETYHNLGDYPKSVAHYRAALEISRRRSEETDTGKLAAMGRLGHSLDHMGRLDEAEPLLVDAAEETRRLLGPGHELCLDSAGFLASLRQHQGRDSDAETLYRRLAADFRLTRGPKDPHTLSALNNLGTVLQKEKNHEEAERIFRECLELSRATRGAEHPGTTATLFNLGFALADLGRVDEAEKLIREALASLRQVLGPDHPSTLLATCELGILLSKLGRLDEAEKLLRACLEVQRRVLGPNNRETLRTAAERDAVVTRRAKLAEAKPPHAADRAHTIPKR